MNMMCVSEKHQIIILGILAELHIYELDPLTFRILDRITILRAINDNPECVINNIRLITCA